MVPIFILVFAAFALVKFGISQWRAIWITTANQSLSDSLQLTAGIDGTAIGAGDFCKLMHLCNELCYVAVVLDQSLSMSMDRQFATRTN